MRGYYYTRLGVSWRRSASRAADVQIETDISSDVGFGRVREVYVLGI